MFGTLKKTIKKQGKTSKMWAFVLTLMIIVAVQLLLGEYLWNNILTRVIPAVKPVRGIYDILGLMLLANLFFPRI